MNRTASPTHERLEALDGLRGFAAILVVVFHVPLLIPTPQLAPMGFLCVDLFFMLSGYVIAHAYERRLAQGLSFLRFLARRMIRLSSSAVIATTVALAVLLSGLGTIPGHSLPPRGELLWAGAFNMFLLPSPFLGTKLGPGLTPIVPPTWSLSFELVINLVWAGLLFRAPTRILVAMTMISGTLLAWLALDRGSFDHGHVFSTYPFGLARVTFTFLMGVALYRLRERVVRPVPGGVFLALAIFCAPMLTRERFLWLEAASVFLLWPAAIAIGAGARHGAGVRAACDWLGQLSYPLYLIHWPVIIVARHVLVEHAPGWSPPPILLFPAALALSTLAAQALLHLCDKPVRAWLTAGLQRLGERRDRMS